MKKIFKNILKAILILLLTISVMLSTMIASGCIIALLNNIGIFHLCYNTYNNADAICYLLITSSNIYLTYYALRYGKTLC